MTPDIQILSIVQIALIGILVVLGMFFLWRKIQRLEQKVEALDGQLAHAVGCPVAPSGALKPSSAPAVAPQVGAGVGGYEPLVEDNGYGDEEEDEDDGYGDDGYGDDDEGDMFALNAAEEAIVQRMFQDSGETNTAFMVFSPFGMKPTAPTTAPQVEIHDCETEPEADAATETESVSRPMTKTKLSKMNVEQLKAYLSTHHASTEGTKKQLYERAVETITLHS